MYIKFRNSAGDEMSLFGNEYFTLMDIDGLTRADVDISSNVMSDMDGDIISSQTVTPRSVTATLRVKDGVNPEDFKRYVAALVKPKQKGIIEMNYRNRTMILTGVIQALDMPRFSNAVAMQFTLYCSQPLWEDAEALLAMISDVVPMHWWAIVPKDEPDIVMGEIMDANIQTIINGGDVPIGVKMTLVALGDVINPRIYRDGSSDFFGVNVTMHQRDELIINTVKGEKNVTLNGVSIMDKIADGSTWLQLEVGRNVIGIDDSNKGENIQFSLMARERYV